MMTGYQKPGEEERADNGAREALVRLTLRDKELLAHVAMARYLTLPQLKRLVFVKPLLATSRQGTRGNEGPSEIVCKRRLMRLCSGGEPYLRRVEFRDHEGAFVVAYAVERHGHAIARQVLRRAPVTPMQDLKAQFLEHTVRLNDLYVALAEGCVRQRIPPARYPFWWISTESNGLPWHERNERTGHVEERRIFPDTILELGGERVRVFLECEMGGHPLVRRDVTSLGSALSKLQRYGAFMLEGGERTFYARKYPDGWKAELVFLVHSAERAANLTRVIQEWQEHNHAVPLVARALSFSQAAAYLCGRLQLPAQPEPAIPIPRADVKLTCAFVAEVTATFKAVRRFLRANPAVREQGCPYPEYSAEFERMVALAERLRSQVGTTK